MIVLTDKAFSASSPHSVAKREVAADSDEGKTLPFCSRSVLYGFFSDLNVLHRPNYLLVMVKSTVNPKFDSVQSKSLQSSEV